MDKGRPKAPRPAARSCTKLGADDIVGIAAACTRLRFLNLDGCHVPGSCVVRVLAARQGIRFCHQLACLADEAEESPMWRDAQARSAQGPLERVRGRVLTYAC